MSRTKNIQTRISQISRTTAKNALVVALAVCFLALVIIAV